MSSFILPGTKPTTHQLGLNADAAFEEAKAARKARKVRDKQLAWDKAAKQLSVWTPSMAVEAMTAMPLTVQQMYLLAEERGLNRPEVLRYFPAVAPSTREAWPEDAAPASPKREAKPRQRKA